MISYSSIESKFNVNVIDFLSNSLLRRQFQRISLCFQFNPTIASTNTHTKTIRCNMLKSRTDNLEWHVLEYPLPHTPTAFLVISLFYSAAPRRDDLIQFLVCFFFHRRSVCTSFVAVRGKMCRIEIYNAFLLLLWLCTGHTYVSSVCELHFGATKLYNMLLALTSHPQTIDWRHFSLRRHHHNASTTRTAH